MTDTTSTPASSDLTSEQRDAESGSDELIRPSRKKQKLTPETTQENGSAGHNDQPASTKSWSGWVELENNPMVFAALLREWGAPNVNVHEIVELDALFENKPESTYGLILLSRWAPAETPNDITTAPEGVWFANQVQSFSCATVALINIIMNHFELNLGQHLNEFRQVTSAMNPLDRGWALDQDDTIRDVHNSFGKESDKRKVDHKLQQDFLAWNKKQKQATKGISKKKKKKKGRTRKSKKQDEDEEENGFHFIAYVPAAGAVWMMDGMERLPRKLGDLDQGDNWLAKSLDDLQGKWESAQVNQFEVSLLSLTERADSESAASEMRQMENERQDWELIIPALLKIHAKKGDLKQTMENFG